MKKKNEFSRADHTTQRVRERTAASDVAYTKPAHAEMARARESPRALAILQNETSNFSRITTKYKHYFLLSQTFSLNPLTFLEFPRAHLR